MLIKNLKISVHHKFDLNNLCKGMPLKLNIVIALVQRFTKKTNCKMKKFEIFLKLIASFWIEAFGSLCPRSKHQEIPFLLL
jgi:hypothetical protein